MEAIKRASNAQKALIHIAKAELGKRFGFSDDDYRAMLWAGFRVRSSKDLSTRDANKFIKALERKGWRPTAAGNKKHPLPHRGRGQGEGAVSRPPADPGGVVTPDQQHVIDGLRQFLGWESKRFQRFCFKRYKTWWPQTRRDGQKIIYALIAIAAPQLLRAIEALDPDALTSWEFGFIFDNKVSAEQELNRFVTQRGKRGHRTMPAISMTKLLEILEKRSTILTTDEHR